MIPLNYFQKGNALEVVYNRMILVLNYSDNRNALAVA